MSSNEPSFNPSTRAILIQVLGVAAATFIPGSGTAIAGGLAAYNAFREALLNKFQISPEEREELLAYLHEGATPAEPAPQPEPDPVTPVTTEPQLVSSKLYDPPRPTPADAGALIANGAKGGWVVYGMRGDDDRWYVVAPNEQPRGNSEVLFTI